MKKIDGQYYMHPGEVSVDLGIKCVQGSGCIEECYECVFYDPIGTGECANFSCMSCEREDSLYVYFIKYSDED